MGLGLTPILTPTHNHTFRACVPKYFYRHRSHPVIVSLFVSHNPKPHSVCFLRCRNTLALLKEAPHLAADSRVVCLRYHIFGNWHPYLQWASNTRYWVPVQHLCYGSYSKPCHIMPQFHVFHVYICGACCYFPCWFASWWTFVNLQSYCESVVGTTSTRSFSIYAEFTHDLGNIKCILRFFTTMLCSSAGKRPKIILAWRCVIWMSNTCLSLDNINHL